MKWHFGFAILILFASCDNNSGTIPPSIQADTVVHNEKQVVPVQTDTTDKSVFLFPGSDTLEKTLSKEKKDLHLETPVYIKSGDSLFVQLSSKDKKANIRITQIEFPDSTFDGPFGQDLRYKIKQHGKYVIITGPNMMAGDPWAGDFNVKAWVK